MFDCLLSHLLRDGIIDNIVSTIIIAVIFFLLKEVIFRIPQIGGIWYLKQITHKNETTYKPYRNMELQYMLSLRVEGNNVYGAAEKIYEDSSFGVEKYHVLHYEGRNRSICELEGYIQKKYLFGKDILIFQLFEENEKRKSTTYYEIPISRKWYIWGEYVFSKGNFQSTIAKQIGFFYMSKTGFEMKEQKIEK